MSHAHAFAAAAEKLVGSPFRFRGRDPATGVDCIGLVATSLSAIGREVPPLPQYQMRNLDRARFESLLGPLGFYASRAGPERAGDLILLRPSAAQWHLAVIGISGRLIHAHGGLGRVVASPPPLAWPHVARWRLHSS